MFALAVILLVPWGGWFGRGDLKLFRDYMNPTDWRENVPFTAILLGIVAALCGLTRGRAAPAVGAALAGGLFAAAGTMSFGALSILDHIPWRGGGRVAAILLCVALAGARCLRRHGPRLLPKVFVACGDGLLAIQVFASVAVLIARGATAAREACAIAVYAPESGAGVLPHTAAVALSAALAAAAFGASADALRIRAWRARRAAWAEAMGKAAILVSAAYALSLDLARAEGEDFYVILRFRWELASAVFLLIFIDCLSEALSPRDSQVAKPPSPSPPSVPLGSRTAP